jgi:hypothetical protein
MERPTRLFVFAILPALVVLSLVRCGPQSRLLSNSDVTQDEAKVSLTANVKREYDIKKSVEAIREALEPVESILRDVDNLADLRVDGKPVKEAARPKLHKLVAKLRDHLRQVAGKTIRFRQDGSWSTDIQIKAQVVKDGQYCDQFTLILSGERRLDSEQATLRISDCFSPESREIARFSVNAEGMIELSYLKEGIDGLKPEQNIAVASDACLLEYRKGGKIDFYCKPLTFHWDDLYSEIFPLEIETDKKDAYAHVTLNLITTNNLKSHGVDVVIESGRQPKVTYCVDGCWK